MSLFKFEKWLRHSNVIRIRVKGRIIIITFTFFMSFYNKTKITMSYFTLPNKMLLEVISTLNGSSSNCERNHFSNSISSTPKLS